MSDARIVWNEFRYQRRSIRRGPQAMFFAVGLPLLYVLVPVSCHCFSTSSLRRSPSNTSTTRSSQHSTPTPADYASSGWTSS
jgi:hypothetical protein